MKLSQWHDGSVKPVHVGFYQVICKYIYNGQSWSYWNGKKWSPQCCMGIKIAKQFINSSQKEDQRKQWRGIVKDKS